MNLSRWCLPAMLLVMAAPAAAQYGGQPPATDTPPSWIAPDGHSYPVPGGAPYAPGPIDARGIAGYGQGYAFVVIPPPLAEDEGPWRQAWLAECHRRLTTSDTPPEEQSHVADTCGGWLDYYAYQGFVEPGNALAVPVQLVTVTHAVACPPPVQPHVRPRPVWHRRVLHDKRIGLVPDKRVPIQ